MKILISGSSTYGVKNMGDDAMLLNLTQQIKKLVPKSEIVFLCRHPSKEYDDQFGFKSIKNFDHKSKKDSLGRYFYGFNKGDDLENNLNVLEEFKSSDLLILGGNLFMEISENTLMRGVSSYTTLLTTIAKLTGIKIVLYGVNIVSKIKSETTLNHCKFVTKNSEKITLREINALENLKSAEGEFSNAKVFADPAWGVEFDRNKENAIKILREKKINIDINKPIISICFRLKYWCEDEINLSSYSKLFISIIKGLNKKIDAQFLMVPNCTYQGVNKYQDDRTLHNEIVRGFENEKTLKIYSINDEMNVMETLSVMSLTDLHLSNRRHSCVFAALNYKNFLMIDNIGLDDHLSPILNELDLRKNKVDLNSNINQIVDKILCEFMNREKVAKKLKGKVRDLNKTAQKQVAYILNLA